MVVIGVCAYFVEILIHTSRPEAGDLFACVTVKYIVFLGSILAFSKDKAVQVVTHWGFLEKARQKPSFLVCKKI